MRGDRSMAGSGRSSPRDCEHTSDITDLSSGDRVCTECGLVLDERMAVEPDRVEPSVRAPVHFRKQLVCRWQASQPPPAADDNAVDGTATFAAQPLPSGTGPTPAEELRLREEILDIACLIHMDTGLLVEQTLDVLREVTGRPAADRAQSGRPALIPALITGRERAVLAFAIWEAMNRIGAPRPPHDVAFLCGVEPGELLRVERQHPSATSTYCRPSQYVDAICGCLQYPKSIVNAVRTYVERIEDEVYGRRPELIVAACIYTVSVGESGLHAQDASELWYLCDALNLRERTLWELIQTLQARGCLPYTARDGTTI